MRLHDLRPAPGANTREKRVGRGPGSGHGKTAGKGNKGQKARSGGGKGGGFDLKIELGGQADGAQQTQVIFAEPFVGRTDRADHFQTQIRFAADPIAQLVLDGVIEQAIHGEIAPQRIRLGIPENHLARPAPILVIGLSTKSRDLKLVVSLQDDNDAKFSAHSDGAGKKSLDLFRERGGYNVKIIGLAAQQKVANTAADPKGGKSSLLQAPDHVTCRLL